LSVRTSVTISLVVMLAWGLTSCDAVQEGADTVGQATDKASICVDALRLAGFTPDLSNPQQAADDAQRTADDLAKLAEQAPDATLRDALTGMSDQVGELNPANITPAGVADWTEEKLTMLDTLRRACG
jgi:hypothetical protein